MVVWLFAGGGEAEVKSLVPLLEKHFACMFERKMPPRQKPGPRPGRGVPGYGLTGKGLARRFKRQLRAALARGEKCNLILVIDDLDCRDEHEQEQLFLREIDSVPDATNIGRFVGFAAPELEAWLIADWDSTIARDVDFRSDHEGMRWWLSKEKKVPFDAPETFSVYDPDKDTCQEKLSDAIIDSARERGTNRYSKAIHTPRLLEKINPKTVSKKCPLFRKLYLYLSDFCSQL